MSTYLHERFIYAWLLNNMHCSFGKYQLTKYTDCGGDEQPLLLLTAPAAALLDLLPHLCEGQASCGCSQLWHEMQTPSPLPFWSVVKSETFLIPSLFPSSLTVSGLHCGLKIFLTSPRLLIFHWLFPTIPLLNVYYLYTCFS